MFIPENIEEAVELVIPRIWGLREVSGPVLACVRESSGSRSALNSFSYFICKAHKGFRGMYDLMHVLTLFEFRSDSLF